MKRLFGVFICLILEICLVGCNMKKKVKYNVRFYDESAENAVYHINKEYNKTGKCSYNIEIIKSYDELLALCDQYNSPAFDEKSEKFSAEVNQLIRSFTKEYFESKALVFYFGNATKQGPTTDIKSIVIEKDTLVINYKKCKGNTETTEIRAQPWTLIIEINQKELVNISKAKVVTK
ncbi:MAG: hypothetical protein NC182_01120 [Prevotella sp.]|nr:hypothetical protein [Staphylococcus sp.]MCM1349783.1 hypothetical protein [Prevotella sp.]